MGGGGRQSTVLQKTFCVQQNPRCNLPRSRFLSYYQSIFSILPRLHMLSSVRRSVAVKQSVFTAGTVTNKHMQFKIKRNIAGLPCVQTFLATAHELFNTIRRNFGWKLFYFQISFPSKKHAQKIVTELYKSNTHQTV